MKKIITRIWVLLKRIFTFKWRKVKEPIGMSPSISMTTLVEPSQEVNCEIVWNITDPFIRGHGILIIKVGTEEIKTIPLQDEDLTTMLRLFSYPTTVLMSGDGKKVAVKALIAPSNKKIEETDNEDI